MPTLRQRFRAHQTSLHSVLLLRRRLPTSTRLRQLSVRIIQSQILLLLLHLHRRALRHKTRLHIHQMPPHLPLIQIMFPSILLTPQRKPTILILRPSHRARRLLMKIALLVDRQSGQLVVGLVKRLESVVDVAATATATSTGTAAAQARHVHGAFVDAVAVAAHLQFPGLAPRRAAQGFG